MTMTSCPQAEELSGFSNGTLDDLRANMIAEHIDQCIDCCDTLSGLTQKTLQPFPWRDSTEELLYIDESAYRRIESVISQWILNERQKKNPRGKKFQPGTEIGPYRIEGLLGQGGMGFVYRALHTRLNKPVALKVLPADQAANPDMIRRFEREMHSVGSIVHPNIVSGFDAGVHEGIYFLAMELIEGLTLSEILRHHGPVPVALACEIIRQTAIALDYVHKRGMLHRDLKPSNLMLSRSDNGEIIVKILDLGLARLNSIHQEMEEITSAGLIVGTLEYMAPEQAGHLKDIDARSDIYSLGATFYCLLTGFAPLSIEQYPTPLKLLKALTITKPVPIGKSVAIRRKLGHLIDSMLEKDPAKRPSSALEIANQLSQYAKNLDLETLFQNPSKTTVVGADSNTVLVSQDDSLSVSPTARVSNIFSDGNSSRNFRRLYLLATLPLSLLLVVGILWLKTDGGYLKIEAPEGVDVTVEVIKDGQFLKSIEVDKARDAIWYRSGNYEIRLPSSDQQKLQITDNVFQLKYRNDQTVTITKISDADAVTNPSLEMPESMPTTEQPNGNDSKVFANSTELSQFQMSSIEAASKQQQHADLANLPVTKTITLPGGTTMDFQLIPPGEFLMGSTEAELEKFRMQSEAYDDGWGLSHLKTEGPQHRVKISKPFYMSRYEMTRAQWKSVTGNDHVNRSYHQGEPDIMPVVEISWHDCQKMIESLNDQFKDPPFEFALPTEAQWEYACRAGTTSPFYYGTLEEVLQNKFWYFGNQNRKEQPVGLLSPNAWGLYDMHGNVHEWVFDRGAKTYPNVSVEIDPTGPAEKFHRFDVRVMRGGSVWDPPTACRSALRGCRPPEYVFHALGVRPVMLLTTTNSDLHDVQ